MPRAERLMDLVGRLKALDEVTVERLADDLRVSPRTIHRDLATLRKRGMPISGEAGPGGGVRLEGGRGLAAVHLSIAELTSLWLAARLSQETSSLPWSRAANSALDKVLTSLPAAKAKQLKALCRRVIVGPPASANVRSGAGTTPPELLRLFEEAFSGGLGLAFHYIDRQDQRTLRRIEPHGLLIQAPLWYILSRDLDRGEPRMFRMDRVSSPRILASVRFLPDPAVIRVQVPEELSWRSLAG